MSAFELLDHLERLGLLEPKVVTSLRKQMQASDKRLSAKSLASLLVRKGQLTASQARRSLESMPPPPQEEEEELGLADEEPIKPSATPAEEIVEPVMTGRSKEESTPPPVAGLDTDDVDFPRPR